MGHPLASLRDGEHKKAAGPQAEARGSAEWSESVSSKVELTSQLAKAGFIEGCIVVQKAIKDSDEGSTKKYKLERIDSKGHVTMREANVYHDVQMETMHGSHLLLDYKVSKARVTERLMGWHQGDPCPSMTPWFQLEAAKAAALLAMRHHLGKHKHLHRCVEIWEYPTAVLASVPLEKKKLILPCVSMNIENKAKDGKSMGIGRVKVGTEEVILYAARHVVNPMDKHGTSVAKPWVMPFWFVQSSKEKKAINMELHWDKYTVENFVFQIPYLTNTKKLNARDVLVMANKHCPRPPAVKRRRT